MLNKNTIKKNKAIRLGIQLFFLVLVLLISINHQLVEKGLSIPFIGSASLHAVCPFGGVVSMYSLITEGSFVQKIHESSFVMLGIVLLLGIVFGPVFCGWICPLGTVQEFIGNIGRKIFKNKYNRFIPYKFDKYLRYLRYLVLVWVVYMTANSGKLLFANIDPYHALFNFWTSEVAIGGLISLSIIIIASLFVERPWCKYACPFGAVLGLTNLVSIFKIRRNGTTCVNCKKCNNSCPMNIEISDKDAVRNHQCIRCLKCTSEVSCPIGDTLMLSTKGDK
jgi:polyferredoxin